MTTETVSTETLTGTIVELQKTFPFERVEFGVILRVMERFGTSQVMGKKQASKTGKPSFIWKVEVAPLNAILGITE